MTWMGELVETWPHRFTFTEPPQEEVRKGLAQVNSASVSETSPLAKKFRKLEKLIQVFSTVLAAATKWRHYRCQDSQSQKGPESVNNAVFCLRKEQLQVAEVMLQVDARYQ